MIGCLRIHLPDRSKPLLRQAQTGQAQFQIAEVSADKGYISAKNLAAVVSNICVLVASIYELGLEPTFASEWTVDAKVAS